MIKRIPLFLLLFVFTFQAQELVLTKGKVMDSIPVNDSIPETYSIYLPSDFSTDNSWPVVFVFDPRGRGISSARLFHQAAEEQGYIIAASNDISASDSLINNLEVAGRMINSVHNFFPLKANEIYTAGFDVGGEVASALPAIFPEIDGVMGSGGVWINPDIQQKEGGFSFVGLVGYEDHKYYDLEETVKFFNKRGKLSRLYKFNGGHEWPDAAVISQGLGTFTWQAIQKGLREDNGMAEKLYHSELQMAESLRRTMQFYKAFELLEQMETKYEPLGKEEEIEDLQKEIKRNKIFKQQRRNYREASYQEEELKNEFMFYINDDIIRANFDNLPWWNQQVIELKKLQEGANTAKSEMAFRLQGFLKSLADEAFKELKKGKASIDPLVFTAILQTMFNKQDPQGYKNIISLTAQDGDYQTALLYLEDLLKTGYNDIEALYDIPGTLDIKLSPEYNALVKKYLGESKFYN